MRHFEIDGKVCCNSLYSVNGGAFAEHLHRAFAEHLRSNCGALAALGLAVAVSCFPLAGRRGAVAPVTGCGEKAGRSTIARSIGRKKGKS